VFPTPTIGMIGIVEDKSLQTGLGFKNEGDLVILIGESVNDINSSEYLYSFHKVKGSPAPHFDLEKEFKVQDAVKKLIRKRLINSAHDVSDGGVFVCLAESSFVKNLGFEVNSIKEIRKDAFLFGEAQSRVIVSIDASKEQEVLALIKQAGSIGNVIGKVSGKDFKIDEEVLGSVAEFKGFYDTSIEKLMN
jgi:phosphoribosylformylglycinamidine synthase